MKKLWITLPAFAPDYSGVCSAMFDLGGLTVIHDASGCTGNYTGYDEPRWYGSDSLVFCSGLREIDAVLGRDDKLIDAIIYAARDLSPSMITVLGSPVPMVIGSDMKGIAHELEERTGLPCFGFDTNGLYQYNKGVSQAMTALIQRFTRESTQKTAHGINILGTTPLDFSDNPNSDDLKQWLEHAGFHVCASMMMGASIDQIRDLTRAEVNLVVTASGLHAAKYLEAHYHMPYVAALPAGDGSQALALIEKTFRDQKSRILRDDSRENGVLIVAEQILGNALRREILAGTPDCPVTVGTMFGLQKVLAGAGDLDIREEEGLRKAFESGKFRCIIGDPLFEELIPEDSRITFCPLPHPAVSSKLYWDQVPRWLGPDIHNMLSQIKCTH